MDCVTSSSSVSLINGFGSELFKPSRELRQGCPLASYLFLMVAEGVSRVILEAKRQRKLMGIKIGRREQLTIYYL
jgi:hypothetical protein